MKNNNISYPYPVLGIGDDLSPAPSLEVDISEEGNYYVIHVVMNVKNEDIIRLISEKKAQYVCELECPATFHRRSFASEQNEVDIKINKQDVARRIYFDCTVTATSEIPNYTNSLFHEDYKGFSFNLSPGDLLAFVGKFYYDADIIYDKLQTAGSFMTIVPGYDENNVIYYLSNPKIEIQLPTALYDDYKKSFNGRGKHADIFHSSMVLNALVFALMNYDEEEYGNKLWARTLKYRIELEPQLKVFAHTLETKDPVEILKLAQALLSNPYKRLISTMHEILKQPQEQQGF